MKTPKIKKQISLFTGGSGSRNSSRSRSILHISSSFKQKTLMPSATPKKASSSTVQQQQQQQHNVNGNVSKDKTKDVSTDGGSVAKEGTHLPQSPRNAKPSTSYQAFKSPPPSREGSVSADSCGNAQADEKDYPLSVESVHSRGVSLTGDGNNGPLQQPPSTPHSPFSKSEVLPPSSHATPATPLHSNTSVSKSENSQSSHLPKSSLNSNAGPSLRRTSESASGATEGSAPSPLSKTLSNKPGMTSSAVRLVKTSQDHPRSDSMNSSSAFTFLPTQLENIPQTTSKRRGPGPVDLDDSIVSSMQSNCSTWSDADAEKGDNPSENTPESNPPILHPTSLTNLILLKKRNNEKDEENKQSDSDINDSNSESTWNTQDRKHLNEPILPATLTDSSDDEESILGMSDNEDETGEEDNSYSAVEDDSAISDDEFYKQDYYRLPFMMSPYRRHNINSADLIEPDFPESTTSAMEDDEAGKDYGELYTDASFPMMDGDITSDNGGVKDGGDCYNDSKMTAADTVTGESGISALNVASPDIVIPTNGSPNQLTKMLNQNSSRSSSSTAEELPVLPGDDEFGLYEEEGVAATAVLIHNTDVMSHDSESIDDGFTDGDGNRINIRKRETDEIQMGTYDHEDEASEHSEDGGEFLGNLVLDADYNSLHSDNSIPSLPDGQEMEEKEDKHETEEQNDQGNIQPKIPNKSMPRSRSSISLSHENPFDRSISSPGSRSLGSAFPDRASYQTKNQTSHKNITDNLMAVGIFSLFVNSTPAKNRSKSLPEAEPVNNDDPQQQLAAEPPLAIGSPSAKANNDQPSDSGRIESYDSIERHSDMPPEINGNIASSPASETSSTQELSPKKPTVSGNNVSGAIISAGKRTDSMKLPVQLPANQKRDSVAEQAPLVYSNVVHGQQPHSQHKGPTPPHDALVLNDLTSNQRKPERPLSFGMKQRSRSLSPFARGNAFNFPASKDHERVRHSSCPPNKLSPYWDSNEFVPVEWLQIPLLSASLPTSIQQGLNTPNDCAVASSDPPSPRTGDPSINKPHQIKGGAVVQFVSKFDFDHHNGMVPEHHETMGIPSTSSSEGLIHSAAKEGICDILSSDHVAATPKRSGGPYATQGVSPASTSIDSGHLKITGKTFTYNSHSPLGYKSVRRSDGSYTSISRESPLDFAELKRRNRGLKVRQRSLLISLKSMAEQFAEHESISKGKISSLEQKILSLEQKSNVPEAQAPVVPESKCGTIVNEHTLNRKEIETVRKLSSGILKQEKELEAKDKSIEHLKLRCQVLKRSIAANEEEYEQERKLWEAERDRLLLKLNDRNAASPEPEGSRSLKKELFEAKIENKRLQNDLKRALSDIKSLTVTLESNNEALNQSVQEVEELRKWKAAYENNVSDSEEPDVQYGMLCDDAESEVAKLRSEIDEKDVEVENLRTRLMADVVKDSAPINVNNLLSSPSKTSPDLALSPSSSRDYSGLCAEVQRMRKDVAASQKGITKHSNHVRDLQTVTVSKEKDIAVLEKDLEEKSKEIEKLNKDLESSANEVTSLKTDLRTSNVWLSDSLKEIDELKQFQITAAAKEYEDLQGEIQRLKSEVSMSKTEAAEATDQIERLSNEMTLKKRETSKLEDELLVIMKEMQHYNDDLINSAEEVSSLKSNLEFTNEMLSSSLKELEELRQWKRSLEKAQGSHLYKSKAPSSDNAEEALLTPMGEHALSKQLFSSDTGLSRSNDDVAALKAALDEKSDQLVQSNADLASKTNELLELKSILESTLLTEDVDLCGKVMKLEHRLSEKDNHIEQLERELQSKNSLGQLSAKPQLEGRDVSELETSITSEPDRSAVVSPKTHHSSLKAAFEPDTLNSELDTMETEVVHSKILSDLGTLSNMGESAEQVACPETQGADKKVDSTQLESDLEARINEITQLNEKVKSQSLEISKLKTVLESTPQTNTNDIADILSGPKADSLAKHGGIDRREAELDLDNKNANHTTVVGDVPACDEMNEPERATVWKRSKEVSDSYSFGDIPDKNAAFDKDLVIQAPNVDSVALKAIVNSDNNASVEDSVDPAKFQSSEISELRQENNQIYVAQLEAKIVSLQERITNYEKSNAEEIKSNPATSQTLTETPNPNDNNLSAIEANSEKVPKDIGGSSAPTPINTMHTSKASPPNSPSEDTKESFSSPARPNVLMSLRRGWNLNVSRHRLPINGDVEQIQDYEVMVRDRDRKIGHLENSLKSNTKTVEKLKGDIEKIRLQKTEAEMISAKKIEKLLEENTAYALQVAGFESAFMSLNDERSAGTQSFALSRDEVRNTQESADVKTGGECDVDNTTQVGSNNSQSQPAKKLSNVTGDEENGLKEKNLTLQRMISDLETSKSVQEEQIETLKLELAKLRASSKLEEDAVVEKLKEENEIIKAQKSALENQLVEINNSASLLRESLAHHAPSSPGKKSTSSSPTNSVQLQTPGNDGIAGDNPVLVAQVVMLENANRTLESSMNSLRSDMERQLGPLQEKIALLEEEKRIIQEDMKEKIECRELTISNLENSLKQATTTRLNASTKRKK